MNNGRLHSTELGFGQGEKGGKVVIAHFESEESPGFQVGMQGLLPLCQVLHDIPHLQPGLLEHTCIVLA